MQPWMKRAAFLGLLGGFGALHVSLVGMVGTFQARDLIAGIVTVGSVMPMLIAILVGWRAGILPRDSDEPPNATRAVASGAIAGGVVGLVLAILCVIILNVEIDWIFVNARPQLADILHFGQGLGVGSLILIVGGAVLGAAGAALNVVPGAIARTVTVAGIVTLLVSLMEPFL
ncbi:MAG TPA: hypothetical protein VF295_02585, partial [Candidatus Limnocylindria bacterium]